MTIQLSTGRERRERQTEPLINAPDYTVYQRAEASYRDQRTATQDRRQSTAHGRREVLQDLIFEHQYCELDCGVAWIVSRCRDEASMTSERERFEAVVKERCGYSVTLDKDGDGNYDETTVQVWWEIWQARAALDAKVIEAADRMRDIAADWGLRVHRPGCECVGCVAVRAYDAARGRP